MRAGARLQLGEQVAHVRLDRLLREEEAVADLAVHQALGDQLEHLDLTRRGLLLELAKRRREGNDLRVAVRPLGGHLVETTRVAHITGQDFLALGSVHDTPRIGVPCPVL
jgi:hypothetical protein